jgi:hypothetical protein
MAERRRQSPTSAALRSKIRRVEARMAKLEDQIEVVRVEAARSHGMSRIRLKRVENKARVQVARAQRALKDSAFRLSQALAGARTATEVARHIAAARATLQDSLDQLGGALTQSTRSVKQEMDLLKRGLKAAIRAGTEAYRKGD